MGDRCYSERAEEVPAAASKRCHRSVGHSGQCEDKAGRLWWGVNGDPGPALVTCPTCHGTGEVEAAEAESLSDTGG